MASFPSPSSQPKMHVGKANRPKRSSDGPNNGLTAQPRDYPITDDFATKKDDFPTFAERHRNTNNKSGFNSKPACPPSGRLAQPPPYDPCRGYGREVGRDEHESSADTATANQTKLVHKEGKNPGYSQMRGMLQRPANQMRRRGGLTGMAISGAKKLF